MISERHRNNGHDGGGDDDGHEIRDNYSKPNGSGYDDDILLVRGSDDANVGKFERCTAISL